MSARTFNLCGPGSTEGPECLIAIGISRAARMTGCGKEGYQGYPQAAVPASDPSHCYRSHLADGTQVTGGSERLVRPDERAVVRTTPQRLVVARETGIPNPR